MKQIGSVFNVHHDGTVGIDTIDAAGKITHHWFDFTTPARRWIFRLLISFLNKETARGRGFFSHVADGWLWMRYLEAK